MHFDLCRDLELKIRSETLGPFSCLVFKTQIQILWFSLKVSLAPVLKHLSSHMGICFMYLVSSCGHLVPHVQRQCLIHLCMLPPAPVSSLEIHVLNSVVRICGMNRFEKKVRDTNVRTYLSKCRQRGQQCYILIFIVIHTCKKVETCFTSTSFPCSHTRLSYVHIFLPKTHTKNWVMWLDFLLGHCALLRRIRILGLEWMRAQGFTGLGNFSCP